MIERIEELHLHRSYSFRVSIANNGTHFSGDLVLSPDACCLTIRGDTSHDRDSDFPYGAIDELVCKSFEGRFFMYGLKPMSGHRMVLQRHPTPIWHFEEKYSVSHVIFTRSEFTPTVTVRAIKIESPSISRWVGLTTKQDQIVRRHNAGVLFLGPDMILDEFEQVLDDIGSLRVSYYPSEHYSGEEFSMGLKFPPALLQTFYESKSGAEAIKILHNLEVLFTFLNGHPLDIKTICFLGSEGQRQTFFLYSSRKNRAKLHDHHTLFPLSINQRSNHTGLPEFPLHSLAEYFLLPAEEKRYFEKYIKHKNLENPEERFLGYFRLLEKLCFQKDYFLDEEKLILIINKSKKFLERYFCDKKNVGRFLKAIPRLNSSKLNTAGCMQIFLKKLPKSLADRLTYGPSDIEEICKIRNNLTHANEFDPDDYEIERKAKFIEVLLVINLMYKIGIPIEVGALIASRIDGFHLAQRSI